MKIAGSVDLTLPNDEICAMMITMSVKEVTITIL